MNVSIEWLGLGATILGQVLAGVWYAAKMSGLVEHLSQRTAELERRLDQHDTTREDLGRQMAALSASMHDLKGWLQRLDSRLEIALRKSAD